MMKKDKDGANRISDRYLEIMEEVKKQYEQYVEVSRLYELPIGRNQGEPPPQYLPPSFDNPLTTHKVSGKRER